MPQHDNYYDDLLERVGDIDEDVEILKQHGILIDKDCLYCS